MMVCIACAVFYIVLLHRNLAAGTGKESRQHRIDEANKDVRDAAQLRCKSSADYTIIDPHIEYRDLSGRENENDQILSLNRSRSVLVSLPESIVKAYKTMPVSLTGANKGIGTGMTGNVSLAEQAYKGKGAIFAFPLNHPRQNSSFCADMGKFAELGISSFYYHLRADYKLSYVTLIRNAVLQENGYVALECGWLQRQQGCMTRSLQKGGIWRANITATIKKFSSTKGKKMVAWQSATTLQQALGGHLPIYDEVFVINAMWDYNYHHFVVESLTRLAPFYHYLRRHEHIKIHIREEESTKRNLSNPVMMKWVNEGKLVRQRFLDLLEFSTDRVISGPIIAHKVYLPSEPDCSSFVKSAVVLRLLSQILRCQARKVAKSGICNVRGLVPHRRLGRGTIKQRSRCPRFKSANSISSFSVLDSSPRRSESRMTGLEPLQLPESHANVLIQWRECVLPTSPNKTRVDWRCFTDTQTQQMMRAAEEMFPQSHVVLANATFSTPLACDIALYRDAHVVIGLHGAAMTNVMFMRPGTVLVEIVGQYDKRMPPVCGFYGPLAAAFGVHHFIYYYDGELDADLLNIADVVAETKMFVQAIRTRAAYTEYSLKYGRYDFKTTIIEKHQEIIKPR